MDLLFYQTLHMALFNGKYNNHFWSPEHATHAIITALLEKYFSHIQIQWKLLQRSGPNALKAQKARNRAVKMRQRGCLIYLFSLYPNMNYYLLIWSICYSDKGL
jgi:hypothetical protein